MDKQRSFSVYLLWAFGIAWGLQVMAGLLYRKGNGAAYTNILAVSMFAPMLAVLLAKGELRGMGGKPRITGNKRGVWGGGDVGRVALGHLAAGRL